MAQAPASTAAPQADVLEIPESDATDIAELTQAQMLESDIQACKNVALADVGVSQADIVLDKVVRYRSHNIMVCELVFRTQDSKYVYKINIDKQEILFSKAVSINGGNAGSGTDGAATGLISGEDALTIAMAFAQVEQTSLAKQEVKLKEKKHIWCYEVEFKTALGVKYEFLINATTGEIIEYEMK